MKFVVIGAEVLIDVSNSPSFADDDAMSFLTTSTNNLAPGPDDWFASTTYDDWATANGSCPCAG